MPETLRLKLAFLLAIFAACLISLPSSVWATCGDSIIDCTENCDDGNTLSGDGCNYPYCRIEYGFQCPGASSPNDFNPIASWLLDELSGPAVDSIAANDGTYTGAAPGDPGAVSGSPGTAAHFDGIDDYISIPHSADYLIDAGTIAFWFKADSVPTGTDPRVGLFSKDHSGLGTGGHLTVSLKNGTIQYRLQVAQQGLLDDDDPCTAASECAGGVCAFNASLGFDACDGAHKLIVGPAITKGVWYHVAVQFGPDPSMQMFINGSLVGSDPWTGSIYQTSGGAGNFEPIALGASTINSNAGTVTPINGFFAGAIDGVYLFDYQLTPTELSAFLNAGTCQSPGGACTPGAPAGCGDGVLDPFKEECDDNNLLNGDGCTDLCILENCGDGIINDTTETCDDGNRFTNDGCDSSCLLEPGYLCTGTPSVCSAQWTCGNSGVEPGEVCDHPLNCSADCQRVVTCGDGIIDRNEECDDYNAVALDGCDANCKIETGWSCVESAASTYWINAVYPSMCNTTCGDNIMVGWEACDDGNVITGDGCDERCQIETCGDGFIRGAEECDDGGVTAGDGCSDTCIKEAGFVCPLGPGKCVPETTCDPGAAYIDTKGSISHNHAYNCPFHETADTNLDLVLDCADGSTIAKYQSLKPFEVIAGDTTIAYDAVSTSVNPIVATIEMAVATSNGSSQPDAGGWTTVVSNGTATGLGNTSTGDFDLVWTATGNFSFPGDGLLVRITETSGTVSILQGHGSSKASYTYLDYDGVYPWDVTQSSYGMPFRLQTGVPICELSKYGSCDPADSLCHPRGWDWPRTNAWCGANGGTATNCELSDSYNVGVSSGSGANGTTCGTSYLYRYTSSCSTSTGACSSSVTTLTVENRFCENCSDEDPCTSSGFNLYSGCTYGATGNVTCWDGDPSKQNIGACSNGIDYCKNPGPECIGANYGSGEVCDGIDNDCSSVIDEPAVVDLLCDDGDPLTADRCLAGVCDNPLFCLNTDYSCGTVAPCTDCTALSGWIATGNQGACCNGLESCLCDEFELRTYYCSGGTTCAYIAEPVSPTYTIVPGTCATCDDANICTTDSCVVATGQCSNPDSGYAGACYYGPAGTEGFGICAGGNEACTGGVLGACDDVQPTTEACNNLDDDCNAVVDDGSADAACGVVGESCWSGQCDTDCASDADCDIVTEFCYFENGNPVGRCAPQTGSCDDVMCPAASTCYEGSCTNSNCGNDLDCNVYSSCYNSGRCLNDPNDRCNGVQCPQGDQCVKGTCKPPCNTNADCSSGNRCLDNFCFPDPDPCAGVDCQVNEVCYQNECFEQCAVDADCTQPGDVCYDAFRCGPEIDPCANVLCPQGDLCYQGSCFPICGTTPDCTDPNDLCYDVARCATDNCEGIQCSEGEACHGGVCYLTCTMDIDCASISPAHLCYGGFCTTDPCTDVQCGTDQVCSGGVCYYTCLTDADCTIYNPGHACYDGICTDDPCAGVLCLANQVCSGGSCYDICTASPDCDPSVPICYADYRCSTDDPCAGVSCPSSDVCYQGACYENCADDLMCSNPLDICYDSSRCAPGPCVGIECPSEEFCYGGSCYLACTMDADCTDPTHACYDGRCAVDACEGVQCGVGDVCYQGTCYQSCGASIDCSDPSHVCYNNLCQDPCDTVTCGGGETCYLGTCYEYCGTDADCSDPTSICYDNRCVDPGDPWCDLVTCPTGEECYRGTCYEYCATQADCSDPNSICYDNTCVPTDCGSTRCESNEICYNGVCYEDCSDGTCDDPADICYDNMRCAASACEAQAQTFIDDYDSNHAFHAAGARLRGEQLSSLPWLWPRPYRPATPMTFDAWADVAAGSGVASNNDALYARGSARVVVYYDEGGAGSYTVYLVQGSKDGAQGAAQATYSVRVQGVDPSVLMTDDRGAEGYTKSAAAGGWTHIQAHVTTGASETGGIAIGTFPAAGGWRIAIAADFAGDIQRWELMNGESGTPMAELSTGETFSLRTTLLAATEEIQPEFGSTCDTGMPGICSRGTTTACVNYQLNCDQTVYGWNFEICDGIDNTCDGLVDALDPTLQFAIVESRQDPETWRPWPTVDETTGIGDWLRYTPASATDDRIGSTDARRLNGTALQDPRKMMLAIHQNMTTGAFSMPLMFGGKTTDSSAIGDVAGSERAGWTLTPRNGTRVEEAAVCWYDDRAPAPTADDVVAVWDPVAQSVQWVSELTTVSGSLESDTVVLRPQWLEGVHGRPTHLAVQRDIADAIQRRWRRYAPYTYDLSVNPALPFEFRVSAHDPADSFCVSDTATASGCRVGTYICTPAGIGCGPPDDNNCIAGCADYDQDGHISADPVFCSIGTDCDDYDPDTFLGATELCDGRDNDCDGLIDIQTLGTCANGEIECGPDDCNGAPVCHCPNGVVEFYGDPVDTCICGEGLAP